MKGGQNAGYKMHLKMELSKSSVQKDTVLIIKAQ